MASQKPKKTTSKKSSTKTETTKETKTTLVSQATKNSSEAAKSNSVMRGFFARKYGEGENILTIFKTPKIWGALIGELIGTMLLVMLFLTLQVSQPIYLVFATLFIYVVIVGISGANLNPLVTVGMMASRRMSAIRGVLYMLAQVLGAWVGLLIINAFRLGSGSVIELPAMDEISGETFWAVALVELLGAVIIAFSFARALRFAKRSALTFAFTVTSSLTLVVIFGIVIAQGYFQFSNSFIFNPAAALMYQILPTAATDLGELASIAGLAIAAYVIVPMIGGVLGFYLSDVTTRLSMGGYLCDCDAECDCHEQKRDKRTE